MNEMRLALEMERIDLISKIEAFNNKAQLLEIDPIVVGSTESPTGEPTTQNKSVDGLKFQTAASAEKYLEKSGWEILSSRHNEYIKGDRICNIYYKNGYWRLNEQ